MEQAAYLLSKTTLSTEDILHTVGYENSSFFHNKFKELYGKTPKEYRREKAAASLGDSNSFSNDV